MRHLIATALPLMLAAPAFAQVGPNIDDHAKELSNPGAANATLNFSWSIAPLTVICPVQMIRTV